MIHGATVAIFFFKIVSEWSRLHYNQDLKKLNFLERDLAVVDSICCIISFIYFTSEWSTWFGPARLTWFDFHCGSWQMWSAVWRIAWVNPSSDSWGCHIINRGQAGLQRGQSRGWRCERPMWMQWLILMHLMSNMRWMRSLMVMVMLMIEIRIRAETGQLIGDQRLDLLVNTNCNALQNWYCTIYCTTCTELALYHVNI